VKSGSGIDVLPEKQAGFGGEEVDAGVGKIG